MIWHRVSASQISTYQTCKRKWYWGSILGKKTLPTAAQARGTAIHTEVEHYLGTGQVRVGQYAALVTAMTRYLPEPRPTRAADEQLLIEHELGAPTTTEPTPRGSFQHGIPTFPGGPMMVGYIDFAELDKVPLVGDVKTTSDFRYAKTPEELKNNTQLMIYGKWISDITNAKNIAISHIYGRTKGQPAAYEVETVVTAGHIAEQWSNIIAVLHNMSADAALEQSTTTALSLTPNLNACNDYGGCPYRIDCGFTKEKGQVITMETLKEKLAKVKAEQAVTSPAKVLAEFLVRAEEYDAGNAIALPTGVLPPDAPPRAVAPIVSDDSKEERIPAKAKRGRPKKPVEVIEASAEKDAAADRLFSTTCVHTIPIPQLDTGPAIYIDCYPVKGICRPVVDVNEWLAPIMRAAAESFQVADYRLIDYGKGKGALAAAIKAQVELGGLPNVFYVSSFAPGADVFLEVMTPLASLVVRGMK